MKKFVVAFFLTLWLTQTCVVIVLSQTRAPGFASLSLVAEPEKAEVVLGEPVTLRIQLTNPTQSGIAAQRDLDPAYGTIQVYVSRNGAEFRRYLGPGWGTKEQPNEATQISPGEPVYRDITLLFHNAIRGRDDLLESSVPINEAGTYQIRVELYDASFRRKIAAPVIDVQVVFPTGESEQAVWQAVEGDENLAYFMQTGDVGRARGVVGNAARLIGSYPDSIQGKHLALALGEYYLGRDNVETAIGYLKQAAASLPASSLRAQALLGLARSYLKKGDMDEALKISEAAGSEYAERDMQQEFNRLASKIRQARESIQYKKNRIQ